MVLTFSQLSFSVGVSIFTMSRVSPLRFVLQRHNCHMSLLFILLALDTHLGLNRFDKFENPLVVLTPAGEGY